MEVKDWLTMLALIATIISSHWLASKQTRNTKKAKWIEDFRLEIARFLSLSMRAEYNNIESQLNLSTCGFTVLMLLNDKKKNQMLLIQAISEFGLFLGEIPQLNFIREYKRRAEEIKDLAKTIINEEERKL